MSAPEKTQDILCNIYTAGYNDSGVNDHDPMGNADLCALLERINELEKLADNAALSFGINKVAQKLAWRYSPEPGEIEHIAGWGDKQEVTCVRCGQRQFLDPINSDLETQPCDTCHDSFAPPGKPRR